jgi:hypothetical protein
MTPMGVSRKPMRLETDSLDYIDHKLPLYQDTRRFEASMSGLTVTEAWIKVPNGGVLDAGVLLIWIDERHWAKFCCELSPAAEPMVVSVVTRGVSDDANAFVVPERSIWLRVSRLDDMYAFHASTNAARWQLVRVFAFDHGLGDHLIGFEAQSPTGDGCTVTFDDIRFTSGRLGDLRD